MTHLKIVVFVLTCLMRNMYPDIAGVRCDRVVKYVKVIHPLKLFQMLVKGKVLPCAPLSHVGGIPPLILSLCTRWAECLNKIMYLENVVLEKDGDQLDRSCEK